MAGHRSRLPLAFAVAAVAAGAATMILRPRNGLIEPAAVEVQAYFSAEELERAEDFRSVQRLLGLAGLGLSGATLALLALRPPGGVRRLIESAERRPIRGAAAVGAGLVLVITIVELPLSAVRHERAKEVGLSTQDWLPWLGDVSKATGVEAVFAAGGAALALALIRRFPRTWWAPAAACVTAVGVLTIYLFPVVVDPLFNDFDPLPKGKLRSDVLELADRAGVDVGEVYRVDASRRTTAANAYVGGLGHTKRVVLYDNLLEDFPPDQVESVVAHELGHVKHDDVPRGLLWLALVAPAATFLVQQLAGRLGSAERWERPGPEVVPVLALSFALVSTGVGIASNVLSRRVEARADAFALELTRDPAAHIGLERRLSVKNVGDPDPPALLHALFGTHPTTIDRIGIGVAYERNDR
jgi:STE24 endopeptidase